MDLLESLTTYLEKIRDKFSEHKVRAGIRCPDSDYSVVNKFKQKQSVGYNLMMDQRKR